MHRSHLCGYDLNLTYPQTQPLPPVTFTDSPSSEAGSQEHFNFLLKSAKTGSGLAKRLASRQSLSRRDAAAGDSTRSFDPQSPLDPWYECDVYDEMIGACAKILSGCIAHSSNRLRPELYFPVEPYTRI
jgi:carboxypeptidase D